MPLPLAHIAGVPVEELLLPTVSAWSMGWVVVRALTARQSKRPVQDGDADGQARPPAGATER
jgi:hypothetical protein